MKATFFKKSLSVLLAAALLLVSFSVMAFAETTAPSFTTASLTLEDAISINFKVNKTDITSEFTNPYAVFTMNGKATTVTEYTENETQLVFTFRGIAPDQMNDEVTAVLYVTANGEQYASAPTKYSVKQYCYNKLGTVKDDFQVLLVDLLNYGAAAQVYAGSNAPLVNADLTDEQKSWASENETWQDLLKTDYATIGTAKATWKGAGLLLQDSVTLRFRFAVNGGYGYNVKIQSKSGKEWTIPNRELISVEGGYMFYFNKLNAAEMSEELYVTVQQAGAPVSNTVRYSVESYAARLKADDSAELVNLVNAMMRYGKSAAKYAK